MRVEITAWDAGLSSRLTLERQGDAIHLEASGSLALGEDTLDFIVGMVRDELDISDVVVTKRDGTKEVIPCR